MINAPLATRCFHLANGFKNFTGGRHTNKRTNTKTDKQKDITTV